MMSEDLRDIQVSASLLLSHLELGDTKFYGPLIRALLGTASQICEAGFLKSTSRCSQFTQSDSFCTRNGTRPGRLVPGTAGFSQLLPLHDDVRGLPRHSLEEGFRIAGSRGAGFWGLMDSGLVGSTDFHSSHPQGHEPEHSGRGTTSAEHAPGTPTQSRMPPSILVYEGRVTPPRALVSGVYRGTSLTRNRLPLGPFSSPGPRVLWSS